MPYVTQAEYEEAYTADELAQLADRDGLGVPDPGVVAAAIERAAGIIDSYLRARFTLPLAETPDLVRECALRIMRYVLAGDHASDRMKDDYDQALKWLSEIRDGKMDVGLTPSDTSPEATGGGPRIAQGPAVFDRDALDAWSGTQS